MKAEEDQCPENIIIHCTDSNKGKLIIHKQDAKVCTVIFILHGAGMQNSMWWQLALVLRDRGDMSQKKPRPGWGGEALPDFFFMIRLSFLVVGLSWGLGLSPDCP